MRANLTNYAAATGWSNPRPVLDIPPPGVRRTWVRMYSIGLAHFGKGDVVDMHRTGTDGQQEAISVRILEVNYATGEFYIEERLR